LPLVSHNRSARISYPMQKHSLTRFVFLQCASAHLPMFLCAALLCLPQGWDLASPKRSPYGPSLAVADERAPASADRSTLTTSRACQQLQAILSLSQGRSLVPSKRSYLRLCFILPSPLPSLCPSTSHIPFVLLDSARATRRNCMQA
jgi:hypothetical protein